MLLCATALTCAATVEPDLRHIHWGMTQAEALATEKENPSGVRSSSGETVVTYASLNFGGLTGRLVYFFAQDQLVRVKYLFDGTNAADPDSFIADFKRVEPLLRESYGKPVSDRAFWQDDETQTERRSYLEQDRSTPADLLTSDAFLGQTLASGHLKLYTQWAGPRTKILHGLTGENNRITHQIEYRSVELEALEDQVRGISAPPAGTRP
jgi:predicted porin